MANLDLFLQSLKKLFIDDANALILDLNTRESMSDDWTKSKKAVAAAVVRPKTSKQVSEVMKLAQTHEISIVPSGGRTGLSGGASVLHEKSVILSLERMNQILEVDPVAMIANVEAGVILEQLQLALAEQELFFGVDLAAKGSCQIGGNIATNAGGTKFVRFGGMREQVVGLEVVLASGDVLNLQNGLRKNNVGPDLLQLFIGSEGTLGVICKATLKISKRPKNFRVCLLAFENLDKLMQAFSIFRTKTDRLSAFEYISSDAMNVVYKQHLSLKQVMENSWPAYALAEMETGSSGDSEYAVFDSVLENLLENGIAKDGVIADSSQEFNQIWSVRERISESISSSGYVYKNDISVPIAKIPQFISEMNQLEKGNDSKVKFVMFGHIGDGNIHLNYTTQTGLIAQDEFFKQCHAIECKVMSVLSKLDGSISAEHGLGHLKLEAYKSFNDPNQLSLQKEIKRVFDPKGILNPGKVYP